MASVRSNKLFFLLGAEHISTVKLIPFTPALQCTPACPACPRYHQVIALQGSREATVRTLHNKHDARIHSCGPARPSVTSGETASWWWWRNQEGTRCKATGRGVGGTSQQQLPD